MEQRSADWYAARLGNVTASRVADIMATTKTGAPAASRRNYLCQLLCERLTGLAAEPFESEAMRHGTETEPLARSEYEMRNGVLVRECGLVMHPSIPGFGASPDGLVGNDGLLEIKCPNTATHIETLRSGTPAAGYLYQMYSQMACTGRQWCDFVSYDDRLPDYAAYFQTRIDCNESAIAEISAAVTSFLHELEVAIAQIVGRKAA
ncbi:lambda exonuclease family protein [Chitiniphilus shinanonensis]|uniref:lambda exonuclease family protein n=1 Tax=Chitiniphilus shinanonensis TaxID=553088 RepID=UPI00305462D1